MTEITPTKGLDRRTVLKGAAWSVPVIAAAAAAPISGATTSGDPGCGCLDTGVLGVFSAQAVTVLGLGTVTGSTGFNLDSSGCDTGFFKPAYTVLGLSGSLTFNNGDVENYSIGATTGVGTIGQISAFTSTFSVLGDINMPTHLNGFTKYPKWPTKVTFQFTAIFVPIIPLPQVECTYELSYDLDPSSAGVIGVLGNGTVNWTDLTPSNPVLTAIS